MGYGTNGLTFNALRGANQARLPEFKDKHGRLAHAKPDGSDWSPAQWLQAVLGELGEYANVRKKYERGDLTLEEFELLVAKELADVQTYLDILAQRCLDGRDGTPHSTGVDLGRATMEKFNEVSERVQSSVRLEADDWHRIPVPEPVGCLYPLCSHGERGCYPEVTAGRTCDGGDPCRWPDCSCAIAAPAHWGKCTALLRR